MSRGCVEGGGGDYARIKLQADDTKSRIVHKRPCGISYALVVLNMEVAEKIVEKAVRLFKLEIEAESF
jgi:hypothetical protein